MRWPISTIGAVCIETETCNPESKLDQEFSYIDISSVDNISKKILTPQALLGKNAPSRARKKIRAGDVLVATVRPNLNAVAMVPVELNGQIASTGFCVLRTNPDLIDNRYLFYQTISPDFVNYLTVRVTGANYPAVSDSVVKSAPITLPPLSAQQQIAAILEKADAAREKRRQANQLTEQFLQSAFLEMFWDYLIGNKNCVWKATKEIAQFIDYRGKTPRKSDSGIKLITAKNVKRGYVDNEPDEFIPEEDFDSWMTRGYPRENDVLFTTEAPLGNVAKLGSYEKVVVGQRIITLQCFENISPDYLMYSLLSKPIQAEILKRSTGSTAKGIRSKEFEKVLIPIPPLTEQRKFATLVEKVESLRAKQRQSEQELEHLFHSLMQRAFRGELVG